MIEFVKWWTLYWMKVQYSRNKVFPSENCLCHEVCFCFFNQLADLKHFKTSIQWIACMRSEVCKRRYSSQTAQLRHPCCSLNWECSTLSFHQFFESLWVLLANIMTEWVSLPIPMRMSWKCDWNSEMQLWVYDGLTSGSSSCCFFVFWWSFLPLKSPRL